MLGRNFFLLGRDRGSNPQQGEMYHSKSSAPSRITPQGRGLETSYILFELPYLQVATLHLTCNLADTFLFNYIALDAKYVAVQEGNL